jgi:hypothetical protein
MTQENHAKRQAEAHLDTITDLLTALRVARLQDNEDAADDLAGELAEMPLGVSFRSEWCPAHFIREGQADLGEYRILLSTGGPAVMVQGRLGFAHGSYTVETAELFYQDWFTPWAALKDITGDTNAILQEFAEEVLYLDGL